MADFHLCASIFPTIFIAPGQAVTLRRCIKINNSLFFKIDIQNFYSSINRMRVTRALRAWAYRGGDICEWSCVANPIDGATPRYVLPIGFVQSPLLASFVLTKSDVSDAINRALANGVVISVPLDDFIGSHDDIDVLTHAYNDIRETCVAAGLAEPSQLIRQAPLSRLLLRCDLRLGVRQGR